MEVRRDTEGMTSRTADEHDYEYDTGTRRQEWNERDRSVSQLVGDLTSQVAHLARVEAQLAAREVADKAKRGAIGGGLFAVAGALALYGGAALAGAALLALALVIPAWASAIIVGLALLVLAGIIALIGRAKLRRELPLVPTETIERTREDVQAMRGRMEPAPERVEPRRGRMEQRRERMKP